MKNFSKQIWMIALIVAVGFLTVGLTSCKEKVEGGTIVVKASSFWYVWITDDSYNRVSGTIVVAKDGSGEFVVHNDGSYWVCRNYLSDTIFSPFRKVSLSGGETVTVTID